MNTTGLIRFLEDSDMAQMLSDLSLSDDKKVRNFYSRVVDQNCSLRTEIDEFVTQLDVRIINPKEQSQTVELEGLKDEKTFRSELKELWTLKDLSCDDFLDLVRYRKLEKDLALRDD